MKYLRHTRQLLVIFLIFMIACAAVSDPTESIPKTPLIIPGNDTETQLRKVLDEHRIVTAGFGVLRNGVLVWSYYYGEESPGIRASSQTRFNVASITKTITAETALRLVAQGRLSLDEPLARYWIDPDLSGDSRLERLTARTVLTHTTGFPNWRFFRRDQKLVFEREPGESYGYSGEGFEYLARAIEQKLDLPFPTIVDETVFRPLGMGSASLAVDRTELSHIARSVDDDGQFHGYFCRPHGGCRTQGSYSAADDLVVTVPDYELFLASLSADAVGRGDPALLARDQVHTDAGRDNIVACDSKPAPKCPRAQGYGLGTQVLDYGDVRIIGHSGADWAEVTQAYVSVPSRDGIIVFLNAPNHRALAAMPRLIELLDPESPQAEQYRRWLKNAKS